MNKPAEFIPMWNQAKFSHLWGTQKRVLNFDGCGTGKTLGVIHSVMQNWPGARVLVFGPLSILESAWANDIKFGWPTTTVAIAEGTAAKKKKAFEGDSQWVITNHDTVKAVLENEWHKSFDVLVIDEGDAFRNRDSKRSKAMRQVSMEIPVMTLMTGTPTPNSITDIWHLAMLVDRGERLGKNFFGFRQQVCDSEPIYGAPPGAARWFDKEGSNDHVSLVLADISTRVSLDDVQEISCVTRAIGVHMPAKLRAQYEFLKRNSMLALESGEIINSLHASARIQKLLQTLSGAVYDEFGEPRDVHPERHKLVLDLVEEADHSIVAFNWTHQRDGLVREAKARKLSYAIIDGETPAKQRPQIVADYQAGKYRVLFAHPQSAGHGLTLTKARRVIWASPNYRADLYEQLNHRMNRKGQEKKTEIIHVAALDSVEEQVYERLQGKRGSMNDLLSTLHKLAEAA